MSLPPGRVAPDAFDVVVVGAGIVGLATSRALLTAHPGLRLVILEKENGIARHQSGRNSGVIHTGIYYRPGSQKATMARAGRRALMQFCAEQDVPFAVCGKVVVATTSAELGRLEVLFERARANGVTVERIGPERLSELEPSVSGVAALHVPEAGVVDFRRVCAALADVVGAAGGETRLGCSVNRIAERDGCVVLETSQGDVRASVAVNCGGLQSDQLAGSSDVRIVPFRGEFYELVPERRHLVRSLVYPVPDPAFPFLGVHFTRDIAGGVHAGPNAVLALAREGYSWSDVELADVRELVSFPGVRRIAARHWRTGLGEVHRSVSRRAFVGALQRLVPAVSEADLVAAPSGVRAQAVNRSGALLDDFVFHETRRVVSTLNAPSPAATASLEIGRVIASRVADRVAAAS